MTWAHEEVDGSRLLGDVHEREVALKARLEYLNRILEQRRGPSRIAEVAARNRATANAMRAEKDRLFHRDLARSMVRERRASKAEVAEVSAMLNVAQQSIVKPWETPSWFKLFRHVDRDGSGLVAYDEFCAMVRDVLKMPERDMPSARLKALWLALDTDGSGHINSGEFGAFMRLGEPLVDRAFAARQSVLERNRATANAMRAEKDRLFHRDLARSMVRERRASKAEVAEVSAMLNVAQQSIVKPWETPSWFKLFRHVDRDGSGLVAYDEFCAMVRDVLKMPERDMPSARLKALWLALDTDGSGHINSGEFGAFMRLGEPAYRAADEAQWEALRSQRDGVQEELRAIERIRAAGGSVVVDHQPPALLAEATEALHESLRPWLSPAAALMNARIPQQAWAAQQPPRPPVAPPPPAPPMAAWPVSDSDGDGSQQLMDRSDASRARSGCGAVRGPRADHEAAEQVARKLDITDLAEADRAEADLARLQHAQAQPEHALPAAVQGDMALAEVQQQLNQLRAQFAELQARDRESVLCR